jgi:hypothetical protein
VGTYTINHEMHSLEWRLDEISADDDSKSGTLEFTIESDDSNAFFPITIEFAAKESLVGLAISKVEAAGSNEAVEYSVDSLLQTEDYLVA